MKKKGAGGEPQEYDAETGEYENLPSANRLADSIKRFQKRKILLPKREYAILASEITRQQSNYRGRRLPKSGTAYTRDYFYVYRNRGIGNFEVEIQIPIVGNKDFIDKILHSRR